MDSSIDIGVIRACTRLSFEQPGAFPEVVRRLGSIGVERYYADLVRLEKTYFNAAGDSERDPVPLEGGATASECFSEAGVQDALAAAQSGRIGYDEFLRRIIGAGVVAYHVFLKGARAVYVGRHGDLHVERFPGHT